MTNEERATAIAAVRRAKQDGRMTLSEMKMLIDGFLNEVDRTEKMERVVDAAEKFSLCWAGDNVRNSTPMVGPQIVALQNALANLAKDVVPYPDVQSPAEYEKVNKNVWETNLLEVVAEIQKMTHEDSAWSWARNMNCKYISLRIDMRDGAFVILDRDGYRISLAALFWQYSDRTKERPQ